MPTISNKLSPASLDGLPAGRHSDGDGLWLYKRETGSAKWVLRVFVYGSRKEMGLGAYKSKGRGVSLSAARKEAAKWRAVTATGLNPIAERDRLRREAERNLHRQSLKVMAKLADGFPPSNSTSCQSWAVCPFRKFRRLRLETFWPLFGTPRRIQRARQ